MQSEFQNRLQTFLRPEQLALWNRYKESARLGAEAAAAGAEASRPPARQQSQTQYVRINNSILSPRMPALA
jgi:hypothetical protein